MGRTKKTKTLSSLSNAGGAGGLLGKLGSDVFSYFIDQWLTLRIALALRKVNRFYRDLVDRDEVWINSNDLKLMEMDFNVFGRIHGMSRFFMHMIYWKSCKKVATVVHVGKRTFKYSRCTMCGVGAKMEPVRSHLYTVGAYNHPEKYLHVDVVRAAKEHDPSSYANINDDMLYDRRVLEANFALCSTCREYYLMNLGAGGRWTREVKKMLNGEELWLDTDLRSHVYEFRSKSSYLIWYDTIVFRSVWEGAWQELKAMFWNDGKVVQRNNNARLLTLAKNTFSAVFPKMTWELIKKALLTLTPNANHDNVISYMKGLEEDNVTTRDRRRSGMEYQNPNVYFFNRVLDQLEMDTGFKTFNVPSALSVHKFLQCFKFEKEVILTYWLKLHQFLRLRTYVRAKIAISDIDFFLSPDSPSFANLSADSKNRLREIDFSRSRWLGN